MELFYRCLVAPQVMFTVVYGISANSRSWWDTSSAEQLGYRPVDNAERWASKTDSSTEDSKGPFQGDIYASRGMDDNP